MIEPFEASRIKLDRAVRHLEELRADIADFFKRDAVAVVCERQLPYAAIQGDIVCWVYRQKESVPLHWSAIIGDVIHNARVALDLAATDVHRVTNGKESDAPYVHFPFCKAETDFADMMKSRRLSKVGSSFYEIFKVTRPFKGGNDGLRALHDLDLLDKHRALVPTLSVASMPPPVQGPAMPAKWVSSVTKDGQTMMVMPRALSAFPVGSKVTTDFSILFDAGAFKHCEVVRQLEKCIASVDHIVRLFKRAADDKAAGGPVGP